jgi:hypothetical protein
MTPDTQRPRMVAASPGPRWSRNPFPTDIDHRDESCQGHLDAWQRKHVHPRRVPSAHPLWGQRIRLTAIPARFAFADTVEQGRAVPGLGPSGERGWALETLRASQGNRPRQPAHLEADPSDCKQTTTRDAPGLPGGREDM